MNKSTMEHYKRIADSIYWSESRRDLDRMVCELRALATAIRIKHQSSVVRVHIQRREDVSRYVESLASNLAEARQNQLMWEWMK